MIAPSATAPAFISSAAVSNVVLTATNHFELASHSINIPPDQGNLGLVTIDYALWEGGFRNSMIFGPDPHDIPDIEKNEGVIVDEFARMGAAEKGAIIGISTTTDEYFKFVPLARLLRKAFPDAQIIAGGSHFLKDDIDGYLNTYEVALRSGFIDGVQVGHAQAFVDLITRHNGNWDKVEGGGLYRLDPSSGDVIGSGVGVYPEVDSVPIEYDARTKIAYLMLRNACPHNCTFCVSVADMAPKFPEDVAIRSLGQFLTMHETVGLYLEDSNPFERRDLEYYENVFRAVDKIKPMRKKIFLSPGLLADRDYMMRDLLRVFMLHQVSTIFIGRDVVTEEVARKIGRQHRGKIKTQERLDDEHEAFKEFIGHIKGIGREVGQRLPMEIVLSYITTPFETRESVTVSMRQTAELVPLLGDGVKISSTAPSLMPYPGSELRRQLADSIHMDAFDFRNLRDGTVIPWKRDAGPSIGMMSDLLYLHDRGGHMLAYFKKVAAGEIGVDGIR